jgi:hypothetical protein
MMAFSLSMAGGMLVYYGERTWETALIDAGVSIALLCTAGYALWFVMAFLRVWQARWLVNILIQCFCHGAAYAVLAFADMEDPVFFIHSLPFRLLFGIQMLNLLMTYYRHRWEKSEWTAERDDLKRRLRMQPLPPPFLSDPFPSEAFPSAPFPSEAFPSGTFPSGAFPSGPFPSEAFPSGTFPSGAFSSGAFPSEAFSSGAFPSGAFSSGTFPSGAFPSDALPSGAAKEATETIDRISVKDGTNIHIIPVEDIFCLQAGGDYVTLFTPTGQHLKEQTLKYFETHLPLYFVRIHRSSIVNTNHIFRVELFGKDNYVVKLKNGLTLKASTTGYRLLRARLAL